MKTRKRLLILCFAVLLFWAPVCSTDPFAAALPVQAHSGRTDSSGGHRDNKNVSGLGYYHYHCGGYPAHLHTNGICPYRSGYHSGSGSGTSTAKKIRLSKSSATLKEGKTLQLKLRNASSKVTWSSSKRSVATVNSKGKVTARKKGTATITARTGSRTFSCKIKVKALALNKTKYSLFVGETYKLKLDTSKKISWSSSDPSIVSVAKNGRITAIAPGKATITARCNKKNYTCQVTVKPIPVDYFYLDDFSINLPEGTSSQITFTLEPEDATCPEIRWSIEDPSIARVDSNGLVTGLSIGETTLTAECQDFTDTCQITVTANFSEKEALDHITCQSYRTDDGIILIIKSDYKYAMQLTADCDYYDASHRWVGTSRDSCNMLEPGQTCALHLSSRYSSDEYDSYKLKFSAEDQSRAHGNAAKISYTARKDLTDNEVSVTLTNHGIYNYSTVAAIVFYKNGQPIAYDSTYANVYAVGETDEVTFRFPYDKDYHTIIPDDYRIFINESYRY